MTGKPRKNPSQVGQRRDSNPGPPECEYRVLPRSHLARFFFLSLQCDSNIIIHYECIAQFPWIRLILKKENSLSEYKRHVLYVCVLHEFVVHVCILHMLIGVIVRTSGIKKKCVV